MRLREQAILGCKFSALWMIALSVHSLQPGLSQLFNAVSSRSGAAPTPWLLVWTCAPAALLSLCGALLWLTAPFLAALLVSDEMLDRENEAAPPLGAQAALRIALILLGLWLWSQSVWALGQIPVTRALIDSVAGPIVTNSEVRYSDALSMQWRVAMVQFAFGTVVLYLSRDLAERTFPNG